MRNMDIRSEIMYSGLKFWQIAEAYGCTDSSFSRKLRKELPPEEKEKIREVITRLTKGDELNA